MKRKEVLVWALLVFLAMFVLAEIIFISDADIPIIRPIITGRGLTGSLALFVEDVTKVLTIHSPTNISYDIAYNITDFYPINLSVSVNFNPDEWRYTLYDLSHSEVINDSITFTPNITILARKWSNNLTISARRTGGDWFNNSVIFYIDIDQHNPVLAAIDDEIYVCEDSRIGYNFNATDVDEDDLTFDIFPKTSSDPFSVVQIGTSGRTIKLARISSPFGGLTKSEAGGIDVGSKSILYTISVTDTLPSVDTKVVNITVIEINNDPPLSIGTQTVYLQGENSTFLLQPDVNDIEDGTNADGNLSFNLTWDGGENLFDINITNGTMVYTPSTGDIVASPYSLTVCVNDSGIENPHTGISSNCSQTGGISVVCDDFSLTITNANRAPRIDSYSPNNNVNISTLGTGSTTFSVDVSDADGTIPDSKWYVDGILRETDESSPTASFGYSFGCGVSGLHNVIVNVTDGLANATLRWNMSITNVVCPEAPVGGGGGGGGGLGRKFVCYEKWACDNWRVCQNTKRSLNIGVLSPEDYVYINEICAQNNQDERFCGFQTTSCFDLEACNNTIYKKAKPVEMRVCYFTESPNCEDGITNCHDGSCELLVDCGGPCKPCSTCSDGIQNQGEENVDCGGPCPFPCEEEKPRIASRFLIISLAIVALIVVIFIIYKLFMIVIYHQRKAKHH